jgi:hypothetical protein
MMLRTLSLKMKHLIMPLVLINRCPFYKLSALGIFAGH